MFHHCLSHWSSIFFSEDVKKHSTQRNPGFVFRESNDMKFCSIWVWMVNFDPSDLFCFFLGEKEHLTVMKWWKWSHYRLRHLSDLGVKWRTKTVNKGKSGIVVNYFLKAIHLCENLKRKSNHNLQAAANRPGINWMPKSVKIERFLGCFFAKLNDICHSFCCVHLRIALTCWLFGYHWCEVPWCPIEWHTTSVVLSISQGELNKIAKSRTKNTPSYWCIIHQRRYLAKTESAKC